MIGELFRAPASGAMVISRANARRVFVLPEFEIFSAIIKAVSVYVMHVFGGFKSAPQRLGHHKTMFLNVPGFLSHRSERMVGGNHNKHRRMLALFDGSTFDFARVVMHVSATLPVVVIFSAGFIFVVAVYKQLSSFASTITRGTFSREGWNHFTTPTIARLFSSYPIRGKYFSLKYTGDFLMMIRKESDRFVFMVRHRDDPFATTAGT